MMNRLIPLPKPHPFWTSSSSSKTIIPAATSCIKTTRAIELESCPYIPPMMYADAWTPVRPIEKTLLAVVNKPRSSGFPMSHSIIAEPAKSCRINPAVTIGPIPSSIRLPRLDAKIIRRAASSPNG